MSIKNSHHEYMRLALNLVRNSESLSNDGFLLHERLGRASSSIR